MRLCQSSNAVDTPFGKRPQYQQHNRSDLMFQMTSNVAAMQQQQLAKQQQMMQSDPECKQLMKRQAVLQSRLIMVRKKQMAHATRMQTADASRQAQIQMDHKEKRAKMRLAHAARVQPADASCQAQMEMTDALQAQMQEAQMQMAELRKNPKYLEMMMPDTNVMRGYRDDTDNARKRN